MKVAHTLTLLFLISLSLFSQERGIGLKGEGEKPSLQSFYRESWAIVIGIDNYLYAPKLRYAVRDAKEVANVLIENFGFKSENVIQLYDKDATKEGIMRAFDRIRQLAREDDRVLVFYAGHGITIPLPDGREKGYILPYDGSQSELITSAISTEQLNEISQLIRAKHLFFVMDACYGGLIFARAQPLSLEAVEYVKVITTRKARKALTAGGRDQAVLDTGPGGHSVFTFYFIDALKDMAADLNRDGMVTTYELNEYVAPRVTAESGKMQTPEYGILAGDMGGDFVFIPVEALVFDVDVEIVSEPVGADVMVGGNFVGKTPISLKLKPGDYSVEISKSGYKKKVESISVKRGENKFNFKLDEFLVDLNIVSSSKSGTVYIDGLMVGSLKDGKLSAKVKPGRRVIKVEGVEESGEVVADVPEVESFPVFVDVVLKPSKLTIVSNVDEADVYVDNEMVGKVRDNKFTLDLKPGKHLVELRKEKYASVSKEVSISAGEVKEERFELSRSVFSVAVRVEPSDAKVYANKKLIGTGSFTTDVGAGKVNFYVEREGYESLEREVVVDRDNLNLEFILKPITAKVKIETEPSEVIILVDGNKVGVTPVTFNLAYGTHEIQLMKSGYKGEKLTIDVRRSEMITKTVRLEETPEMKAMRIYRSKVSLKNNLTYIGAGFTVISAGVAVAFHIKSEDIYSKYQAATEVEKIQDYKKRYKNIVTWRNVMIGVSSVFAGFTAYNFFRKVSYDDIYREVKSKEVSMELRYYEYIGVVPVASFRFRF
ncbi:PEGA domain-containing protein [Candidatus Kryptonium thompsonii]|uniref:PEGA domain-containing protein n=1 Tax=Candidatus Kryptonium thompsonii TaxID=1633631 RepID=UPI0007075A85|nr:PEGA domain-containing protein [Candidatus Kryptonium thompsoni]CUS98184.1 PEGA domain-containing protein [Candidatus Kryptonium thompsoni]